MKRLTVEGLAGQTVIVTGANGGQGAAEVRLLLENGADVIAADLAQAPGELLSEARSVAAGSLEYRQMDVTSPSDWQGLANSLRSRHRTVRGLVNNAGIAHRARLGEVALEDWNRVLGINLTGPLLGIQAMTPLMGPGGSIVNIGSAAGLNAHHTVAYTASKWGLRGLTHAAATQLGPRGIRTNIVHPGYIETPMMAAAPRVMTDAQLALTPLERTGQPEEVAAVVAFLLSDAAAYVCGAEIPVDGGFTSSGGVKYMADKIAAAAAAPSTTETPRV